MNKKTHAAKIRSDGTVVEVLKTGKTRAFSRTALRPMTPKEIKAAALSDPDAKSMTLKELKTARRIPRTKTLRRALGLTQKDFALRYHIPLGTLRDWEQGCTQPDQAAKAYLTVIARDPEGISHILDHQ